ncbi:MAG: type IV secretion system protein [Steroidobacteraceae bacterium]|jgi:type IV secretion system protein VirB5
MSKRKLSIAICLALATAAPAARAQWAVIDVNAIAQLARQVQTLEQQLATARNQLETASMQFQSMTGSRGMERLLAGTVRNYLPADWSQLTGVLQGAGGGYPGLAASYQGLLNGNAVLTAQGLAALSTADQQLITGGRQRAAMNQALSRQALTNSSSRFASIQSLINAIPTAGDQKAILELATRISAELGMLQNEQTKLQVLSQNSSAEEAAGRQREREQAVVAQGQFATRFRPIP